ncbi:MAG: NAD(+)/NADH kinase [Chloroflexi bacterium]|nr:NAD(+)/NADH kinase [Chloroflexota bacterium]
MKFQTSARLRGAESQDGPGKAIVGIIANPAAGRDIRRLVAQGRVVSDQEKANTLRRVFAGLCAVGVKGVLVMPDRVGLARLAREDVAGRLHVEYVDMVPGWQGDDSTVAAQLMVEAGVRCIVTLGGDGTNRVVAKACRDVPVVPISTGTNNVFPQMVEGTLAGLAAGAVATGIAPVGEVCRTSKRLDVYVDGEAVDIALVDAAVSREMFTGARAIWDLSTVQEVYLTRAEPASIGISSIGAQLGPIAIDDPSGLYFRLGDGKGSRTVVAPIAPGVVKEVSVTEWRPLKAGERHEITMRPGTLALDGEREIVLLPGHAVEIGLSLDGPRVVQIERAMRSLIQRGGPPLP